MPPTTSSTPAQIQITEPRLFNASAGLVVTAYGIVGIIPVFILFLVVSLLGFQFSTLLVTLAILALVALVLPLARGNPHVTRLVRSLHPDAAPAADRFIVQLALSPRIQSGFRALVEDADDIGYLTFTDSGLLFYGDSVKLWVPFDQVTRARRVNRGLRGLFVPRILVDVAGLPNISTVEFSERSSLLLPASRRISKKMHHLLAAGIAKVKPATPPAQAPPRPVR